MLALLEGTANPRPRPPSSIGGRSSSPYTTPRSPVRSMLDIGDDLPSPTLLSPFSPTSFSTKTASSRPAPVRSMLDVNGPAPAPIRSMLDIDSPPPAAKQVLSTPSSPTTDSNTRAQAASTAHSRSMSDAALKPVDFGPRAARHDPTTEYQFSGIITNNVGQALPKRNTQGGKRSSAMAEVMRGNDVTGLVLPGDRGRHQPIPGPLIRPTNKSKSPHNRMGMRSHSPRAPPAVGRPLSPAGQAMLGDKQDFDINNAYRRLSDAALARFGGSLSEFGRRKTSDDAAGRLAKDYMSPDGDLLVEESSEDNGSSSDEDERGRKTARSFENLKAPSGSESPESQRQARSLLAAAEEERT